MTLTDICQRVEADIKAKYPELIGDDPLYFFDLNAGAGHCYGYDFYRPAAPSAIPPFIVQDAIDARGRAAIAFGVLPADDRVWHERGHSLEALAVRRGHHGYAFDEIPTAYDAGAFQERFWQLLHLSGTYRDNYTGGTGRAPELFAEVFAVVNTGFRTTIPGADVVRDDPDLIAFYRSLLTTVNAAPRPLAEWHGPMPGANHMLGRDGTTVDRIVIHTTAGRAVDAEMRFKDPSQKVSAHYLIRTDGTVWQFVAESDTAYHAGNWSMNLRSVGIEHEDGGAYDDPRPDALYTSSAVLVKDICSRLGIPCDRTHILAHREVSATKCPDALDVERIVREAGGDMAFKDDPDAIAYQADVRQTFEAIKAELASLAHHLHYVPTQAGTKTSEPQDA